jgi:hypothetical protein
VTKCPWCFTSLNQDSVSFVCANACNSEPDPAKTRWTAKASTTATITTVAKVGNEWNWKPPATRSCRACNGPTVECCPECHNAYPPDWRNGEAIVVALAGARATGKSVYVGVLGHFVALAMQTRQRAYGYADEKSREEFEVYEHLLFVAQGLPGATGLAPVTPSFHPMVMALGEYGGKKRYLVLRDVAGEELEGNGPKEHLGFFARADLAIFLFDPLWVDFIRDQVAERIEVKGTGGSPDVVLGRVLDLMGPSGRLAICMSKFDILHEFATLDGSAFQPIMANLGSAMRRDVGPGGLTSDAEMRLLDVEVQSLLSSIGAQNLVNTVKSAEKRGIICRFFAVSALGSAPTTNGINSHGIAPFRVLDPIMWVMREKKAI